MAAPDPGSAARGGIRELGSWSGGAPAPSVRLRREHYFYALWRVLLGFLLLGLAFSPLLAEESALRRPWLIQLAAVAYLVAAGSIWWLARRPAEPRRATIVAAVLSDAVVAALAQHALPEAANGIAFLLLVSVGAGAVLLPPRLALALAAAAAAALLAEPLLPGAAAALERPAHEAILLAIAYLGLAALANLLAERLRQSQALAERRGEQAASLAQLNELIVRRLRTGVIAVDGTERIVLANAVARRLLGVEGGGEGEPRLRAWSVELSRLLRQWRQGGLGRRRR